MRKTVIWACVALAMTANAFARDHKDEVMYIFGAEWCGPCKSMNQYTWPHLTDVMSTFKRYNHFDIDTPRASPYATHYKIDNVPTVIVVDSESLKIKRRIVGKQSPKSMREFLERE